MGWTVTYDTTIKATMEELTRDQQWPRADGFSVSRTCLARCLRGMTMYAVMQDTVVDTETLEPAPADKQPVRPRWIMVVLIRNYQNGEIGYKDMDESMGPAEVNCPLSYLDMAGDPAPESQWASEWYQKVRAYHDEKAHGRALAKLLQKPGDIFQTSCTRSYEFVRRRGQWLLGYSREDGVLYRIMPDRVRSIVLG